MTEPGAIPTQERCVHAYSDPDAPIPGYICNQYEGLHVDWSHGFVAPEPVATSPQPAIPVNRRCVGCGHIWPHGEVLVYASGEVWAPNFCRDCDDPCPVDAPAPTQLPEGPRYDICTCGEQRQNVVHDLNEVELSEWHAFAEPEGTAEGLRSAILNHCVDIVMAGAEGMSLPELGAYADSKADSIMEAVDALVKRREQAIEQRQWKHRDANRDEWTLTHAEPAGHEPEVSNA